MQRRLVIYQHQNRPLHQSTSSLTTHVTHTCHSLKLYCCLRVLPSVHWPLCTFLKAIIRQVPRSGKRSFFLLLTGGAWQFSIHAETSSPIGDMITGCILLRRNRWISLLHARQTASHTHTHMHMQQGPFVSAAPSLHLQRDRHVFRMIGATEKSVESAIKDTYTDCLLRAGSQ